MSRVDFSGRWHFSPDASALQIEVPDSVVFTIEHREPFFHLERTLTFGGRSDTFAIDLTAGTGGSPVARGDATLYPSLWWDGDHLVFLTRIVRGGEEATNRVRYRLEKDGTILVAEESYRSSAQSYDNKWVFTKGASLVEAPPDAAGASFLKRAEAVKQRHGGGVSDFEPARLDFEPFGRKG